MNRLHGELYLPGDKSISHRALMLLAISRGLSTVKGVASGKDVLSTLRCLQALGCKIEQIEQTAYRIQGVNHFIPPEQPLDCGNSGTTIRLLSGLLAGAGVLLTLTGDESLQKRPMKRIIVPLSQMGCNIQSLGPNECAPLQIDKPRRPIQPIHYKLPMASAQVKSAILLAGLFTDPKVEVIVEEPTSSRDHTERMLRALGAYVKSEGTLHQLMGRQPELIAQNMDIPGDVSSAAFWLVGGAILPGSKIRLKQVGLNPLRSGLIDILKTSGANITFSNLHDRAGEPCGDILLETDFLMGNITITPQMIPALIDEIPVLTILGLFTQGRFTLRGAEELRFKESDRLGALIEILKALKVDLEVYADGFSFEGRPDWDVPKIETSLRTYHDHRLVMALEILNLRSRSPLPIEGKDWVSISYPGFYKALESLVTTPLLS